MGTMLLPLVLVVAGVALGAAVTPVLVDWYKARQAERRAASETVRLAEEVYADQPLTIDVDAPRTHEDCRPVESARDRAELEALHGFIRQIDVGLDEDDPTVWPDEDAGGTRLDEARALMDEAEQLVERLAPRTDGGVAAADTLHRAVDAMLEAKEHWSSGAECRAELARAVWIRSRARQHRYRKSGLAAVLRLANDALERDPHNRDAQIMRVRAQVGLGKLDAARFALIELMGRYPGNSDVLRTRSRWLWAHGDVQGACNAILDVVDRMPERLAVAERLRIGPGLLSQGRFNEAADVYDALLEWRDDLAELWTGRARCLLEARKYKDAADAARKSIELEGTAEARDVLKRAMVAIG